MSEAFYKAVIRETHNTFQIGHQQLFEIFICDNTVNLQIDNLDWLTEY